MNGQVHELLVEPSETLNSVLRNRLKLTGTKRGCDTGGCGSCTVLVNGRARYSCMTYVLSIAGSDVVTIEGLSEKGILHPIQEAFVKHGALQCGYCTPGLIMAAKALLDSNPESTEEEIRDALVGNLCRCTGYSKIIKAISAVVKPLRKAKN